jgi:hypothetical protein
MLWVAVENTQCPAFAKWLNAVLGLPLSAVDARARKACDDAARRPSRERPLHPQNRSQRVTCGLLFPLSGRVGHVATLTRRSVCRQLLTTPAPFGRTVTRCSVFRKPSTTLGPLGQELPIAQSGDRRCPRVWFARNFATDCLTRTTAGRYRAAKQRTTFDHACCATLTAAFPSRFFTYLGCSELQHPQSSEALSDKTLIQHLRFSRPAQGRSARTL